MSFAPMGAPSPFSGLLAHLAEISQPSPLIPNPNLAEPQSNRIGWFGPHGGGIANPAPPGQRIGYFGPHGGGIATLPIPPTPTQAIQQVQPLLPNPPDLGLFPHVDPGTALANIHQVLAHHHSALQSLLAVISGMAHSPVGVDAHGHTQAGFHSQSTHNATVARRSGSNHPLPLQ